MNLVILRRHAHVMMGANTQVLVMYSYTSHKKMPSKFAISFSVFLSFSLSVLGFPHHAIDCFKTACR